MTQSFDELFAPKAMSLDELFAAIRPPPLLPVNYPPSDNSDFMSPSSASGVNMPQPIPLNRLSGSMQPALAPLNYRDPPNYEPMPAGSPLPLAAYTRLPAWSAAPSDSNPFEIDLSPLVNSMFSGASNVPRLKNIAAQRQMPVPSQPKIYGNALDASNPSRPLIDDQIASIIFNETRSLSGPTIDDARYNNAMVILHNNLNLRTLPKMAPPRATVPSQEQAAYDSILSLVRRARSDFLNGINPTNGATNFNFRPTNSAAPHDNMPVRTQVGPLRNSFPTQELPANGIYANTYGR